MRKCEECQKQAVCVVVGPAIVHDRCYCEDHYPLEARMESARKGTSEVRDVEPWNWFDTIYLWMKRPGVEAAMKEAARYRCDRTVGKGD